MILDDVKVKEDLIYRINTYLRIMLIKDFRKKNNTNDITDNHFCKYLDILSYVIEINIIKIANDDIIVPTLRKFFYDILNYPILDDIQNDPKLEISIINNAIRNSYSTVIYYITLINFKILEDTVNFITQIKIDTNRGNNNIY